MLPSKWDTQANVIWKFRDGHYCNIGFAATSMQAVVKLVAVHIKISDAEKRLTGQGHRPGSAQLVLGVKPRLDGTTAT